MRILMVAGLAGSENSTALITSSAREAVTRRRVMPAATMKEGRRRVFMDVGLVAVERWRVDLELSEGAFGSGADVGVDLVVAGEFLERGSGFAVAGRDEEVDHGDLDEGLCSRAARRGHRRRTTSWSACA